MTGRINFKNHFGANCVKYMLDKRQSGIEIANAKIVTQTDVTINGQKPNSLSEGYQSSEKISLLKGWVCKSGSDLKTSPAPIASGNKRQNVRQTSIHLEEILSFIFRERIIGGGFWF